MSSSVYVYECVCMCIVCCVQRPPAYAMRQDVGSGLERDDDDEWQQRRKQQSESMMAAIERARQRREDDERRIKDEQSTDRVRQRQANEVSRQDDRVCCSCCYNMM